MNCESVHYWYNTNCESRNLFKAFLTTHFASWSMTRENAYEYTKSVDLKRERTRIGSISDFNYVCDMPHTCSSSLLSGLKFLLLLSTVDQCLLRPLSLSIEQRAYERGKSKLTQPTRSCVKRKIK